MSSYTDTRDQQPLQSRLSGAISGQVLQSPKEFATCRCFRHPILRRLASAADMRSSRAIGSDNSI